MAEPENAPTFGVEQIAVALAAQTNGPPARPKRFFTRANVVERDGRFALRLDERSARTPARRDLAVPTRAAAEALAAEWNALGDTIEPSLMPLTRIVNAAIDGVAGAGAAVEAEVNNYVGTDLLFYRAAEPDSLVADQALAWDPILAWCDDTFDARFFLAEGVMHVDQPPAALAAMAKAIADAVGRGDAAPFRLAALNVMTTLTGSALLAIAVMYGRLDVEAAWAAAHVDETFQEAAWGRDEEAMARRDARARDMRAAARLAVLV